jgi:hypothetical protein
MNRLKNYTFGAVLGALVGVLILHPFSMIFSEMIHPEMTLELNGLKNAFNPHHLPMALFFGILGTIAGTLNVFFVLSLTSVKKRVRLLEKLLPICAYCKKIRDDRGKAGDAGQWHQVEHYISKSTDTVFTHGMCPDCYDNVMKELDEEKENTPASSGTATP